MLLCGTDLSSAADPAVQSAAALSRKLEQDLLLVTVMERADRHARASAAVRLEHEAAELRRCFDISVETSIVQGAPDVVLATLATEREVQLVVLGAAGARRVARRLGSVPEQLCQRARVPVLIVRAAEGLLDWARGQRALRVLVGSDLSESSRGALDHVGPWPQLALTVAHVAWPYDERYRGGEGGPLPLDHLRPEVHHQLRDDLSRWTAQTKTSGALELRVVPGWGRLDAHLAGLAREKDSDLLVVGNHLASAPARAWHGCTARNVIHEADASVLCVPQKLTG